MSKPVTIEDIYELFRASQAEADRRAAEADRTMEELKQQTAPADSIEHNNNPTRILCPLV